MTQFFATFKAPLQIRSLRMMIGIIDNDIARVRIEETLEFGFKLTAQTVWPWVSAPPACSGYIYKRTGSPNFFHHHPKLGFRENLFLRVLAIRVNLEWKGKRVVVNKSEGKLNCAQPCCLGGFLTLGGEWEREPPLHTMHICLNIFFCKRIHYALCTQCPFVWTFLFGKIFILHYAKKTMQRHSLCTLYTDDSLPSL